ncbi:cytochrome D1 domain-containing protein [Azotobacter chroococcum]|uniref:YVTN family beta-propeller protein n=1 Tax=Azotobacter chroococcum TaxID=353 RepID=A0A4V6NG86_9GAMM|nr:cytochrome D1 domain-containing protein [Azotobacter chroococcum]TCL34588.1 YVTN family beta-propeller protein [Azotobacter chroococcum]
MKAVHKGLALLLPFGLAFGAGLFLFDSRPPAPGEKAGNRLVRDGIAVEFAVQPVDGAEPTEGMFADLRFRLSDAASGQPLAGQVPGAWLDLATGNDDPQTACRSRIGLYLKGLPGVRPLLDLTSYYLLILNRDPSITVVDPLTSVGGTTSMLTRIPLRRPPMDWVSSPAERRLYVSMPEAGEVAVIDAERFQVLASVPAGARPVRLALQPDGRYLWVGNDAAGESGSGVTVIDTRTLKPVLQADTGRGHHEIAFSADSRHAFVSSREAGTLTVFDVATLERIREIRSGPHPLGVALSPLSGAVYVSDGEAGTLSVIDAVSLETRKTIPVGRGIGPLAFAPDGRYGFVLNTADNTGTVIDAASDEVLHRLEVAAEPYQIAFTRAFAYVRGLASPKVSMIDLASLGKGREPGVLGFEVGPAAPRLAGNLPLASSLAPAGDDAALFVVNPVDNTIYFYMEGMNAPMSGYLNRGHTARAATVVPRSLRELEPGLFGARVRLPAAGRLDVAFLLNQPQIAHCFAFEVRADPDRQRQRTRLQVEYLVDGHGVVAGAPFTLRLRLLKGGEAPQTGVADLRVRYFRAPSAQPREVAAREVGEGIYEASVELAQAGAYYLHLGAASLGLKFGDLPYLGLRARPAGGQ